MLQPTDATCLQRLALRAAAGDRQAFTELYERYVARVYRYIYYATGGGPEVEDLTAQAFLNAWRKIGSFEPRGASFGPWLLRIAHNLTVSHLRNRHNSAHPIPEDYQGSAAEDPAARADQAEENRRLRSAIMSLPAAERQAIVLRFVDGLSYQEAAVLLGRKPNAVRVAQCRGLARLRGILGGRAVGKRTPGSLRD